MTDNCSGRKFRKQGEPQENKNRVETEGQETGYVWADTHLPPYLPYPRFLLKMDITQTAKLLYALLLDRTTITQFNYAYINAVQLPAYGSSGSLV